MRPKPAPLCARHRGGGGEALGAVCLRPGVDETPGQGLERAIADGEERLGSAEWCGSSGAVARARSGTRGTGRCRYASASPIVLRERCGRRVPGPEAAGYRSRSYPVTAEVVVERVANAAGIDTWLASSSPPKDRVARRLGREGHKVLMVGDGLNDAPALAAAHASLSPASAADISQRAADFVFQGASLRRCSKPCRLPGGRGRLALQNFAVAAVYNVICVPLAMAGSRYTAHRRHRNVYLLDPGHAECCAAGGRRRS